MTLPNITVFRAFDREVSQIRELFYWPMFCYTCRFGSGKGQIWLDDVDCTSSDTELLSCSHNSYLGDTSCSHAEDISVYCTNALEGKDACISWTIILVAESLLISILLCT